MEKDMIERVLRNISHEIKNPLTSIKGYAQLIDMKIEDKDFIRKARSIIIENVEEIDLKIRNLYSIFAIKYRNEIVFEAYELIKELISMMEEKFQNRINVKNNCKNGIITDKELFRRAIELLVNGFDWNNNQNTFLDIEINSGHNQTAKILFFYKGIDFSQFTMENFFLPYSGNSYFVNGCGLYEIYTISAVCNWGFGLINEGDPKGFVIEIPWKEPIKS